MVLCWCCVGLYEQALLHMGRAEAVPLSRCFFSFTKICSKVCPPWVQVNCLWHKNTPKQWHHHPFWLHEIAGSGAWAPWLIFKQYIFILYAWKFDYILDYKLFGFSLKLNTWHFSIFQPRFFFSCEKFAHSYLCSILQASFLQCTRTEISEDVGWGIHVPGTTL